MIIKIEILLTYYTVVKPTQLNQTNGANQI